MKLSLKGLKFWKNLDLLSGLIFVVLAGLFIDVVSTKEATALTWRSRPVSWTSLVGVSVEANNTLKKTAATGWGNSGAASVQSILADGEVDFLVNEINTTRICGLSYSNANSNYDTIDYGILLNYTFNNITNTSAYNLEVYERGVSKGIFTPPFATNDRYSVERAANTINYKRNGSTFYTSTALTGPLLVDTALNTITATIADAQVITANNPPVAYNQNLNTTQNTALYNINLNATDLDNDPLNYTIVNNPVNGNLTGTPPLNMTYTPNTNFYGLDGFSFKAYDGFDYSNIANVNINVTQVNNPPNLPIAIYPLDNAIAIPIIDTTLNWQCTDPDLGDTLIYDLYFGNQTNPSLVAGNLTNSNYPLATLNYNTTYYWKVKATDNHGSYRQGTEWDFVTELYSPPNVAPRALNKNVGIWMNTPTNITLEATDSDGPLPLTYEIVTSPSHGSLDDSLIPLVTYTPNIGFAGKDTFTFKAFDGGKYSNVATVGIGVYEPFTFSDPEQLDAGTGTQPTLSYAPNGDLRAFYNVGSRTSNNMVLRKRASGQPQFDPGEISVYDDARTAAVHYDTLNLTTIDLAVETAFDAVVLQSLDNGNTWIDRKIYQADYGYHFGDAYLPLGFTEDNPNHLRLFYGRMVIGIPGGFKYRYINYAQRINGEWDNDGVIISSVGMVSEAFEIGDHVYVFNGLYPYSSLESIDNGIEFEKYGHPDVGDAYLSNTGRRYLLRAAEISGVPVKYDLWFHYSDGNGAGYTGWGTPQFIIRGSSTNFLSPNFAFDRNRMVVAWASEDIPNQPQYIRCIISKDEGKTWSPVQTIVSLPGTKQIGIDKDSMNSPMLGDFLDIENYNGKFTLVYSVMDGDTRDGVYLKELDLPNSPPVLNSIGNKSVKVGQQLQFTVSATDPDWGDTITLTALPLPSGATFTDNGDGTGVFTWTPNSTQVGTTPPITSTASDGALEDTEDVTITVTKSGGGRKKPPQEMAPIE